MLELIRKCMEGVEKFAVPLKVEIGEGHSWGEAHA
jgi:DNA polymerase I-like protein with 3'-5' exonuclease and polymerase domains